MATSEYNPKTHLALSASLQPYAGLEPIGWREYPFKPSALAREFTAAKILFDQFSSSRVAI